MKAKIKLLTMLPTLFLALFLMNCSNQKTQMTEDAYKIIFLHHSTGNNIWKGFDPGTNKLKQFFNKKNDVVPIWINNYNTESGTNYFIKEQTFPKDKPYGWQNYPFDYYNIWVKNAGEEMFKGEPTLEILTKDFNLIIFKHCFPVSKILADSIEPDISSRIKTLENYKLQYVALKEKMLQFPETKFLVWTGAVMVEAKLSPIMAERTKVFFDWVRNEWDTEGDNIYIWDFYELETEGGLYLTEANARNKYDSHLNGEFAAKVAPLFCQRIVDIIETNGQKTSLTGVKK